MRRIVLLALVVICALAIVHAFFMPWAKASASATKVAKGVVQRSYIREFDRVINKISALGDIQIKTTVSGYDIPTLVNKETSQIAIAIASAMFKDVKDLDKKSMLVYLLPLLALVCIGLAIVGLKTKIAIIVMAVLSGGIAVGGLYNLMTVNLSNLPIQISIEQGLWRTMYAYLVISIIGIVWIVLDLKEAKR